MFPLVVHQPASPSILVHGTGLLSLKLRHWLYLDPILFKISVHPFHRIPEKGPAEYWIRIIWAAVQSLWRGMSTIPGVRMWCVCWCSWRDDVCRECYRGVIVVIDVILHRICVNTIWGKVICFFFWLFIWLLVSLVTYIYIYILWHHIVQFII